MSETSWQRALSDTNISGPRFWLFDTILALVVAGVAAIAIIQWGPDNPVVQAAVPFGAALVWLLVGAIGLFGWNLIRAPYRQRDELRDELGGERNDVDHVIEKLRNQTGASDRNMTMADVLDELADQIAAAAAVTELTGMPTKQERDRFIGELRINRIIEVHALPGKPGLTTCHLTDFGAQVVQRLRAE